MLQNVAYREDGFLGCMFTTLEYYVFPAPRRPTDSEMFVFDVGAIEEAPAVFTEELKMWVKEKNALKNDRAKIFEFIWASLSTTSREKVKEDSNWEIMALRKTHSDRIVSTHADSND